MVQYTLPLRDMQFVMHELLERHGRAEAMPHHADIGSDADTLNAVLEEAGKFAAQWCRPQHLSGDAKAAR